MRIVRTRYKVLLLLAGYAVLAAVTDVLDERPAAWVGYFLTLAIVAVAVRTFRVPEEDIAAPRPLWRLTGRPSMGFVLGFVVSVNAVFGVFFLVLHPLGAEFLGPLTAEGLALQIVEIVTSLAVGVLYFRSSRRIARLAPSA